MKILGGLLICNLAINLVHYFLPVNNIYNFFLRLIELSHSQVGRFVLPLYFFDHLKKIAQTEFKMNYKVKYMQRKPIFDEKGKRVDAGQLI